MAAQTLPPLSAPLPTRAQILESLNNDEFDILVIGGGATGAGVALDAVNRGEHKLFTIIHYFKLSDVNVWLSTCLGQVKFSNARCEKVPTCSLRHMRFFQI